MNEKNIPPYVTSRNIWKICETIDEPSRDYHLLSLSYMNTRARARNLQVGPM